MMKLLGVNKKQLGRLRNKRGFSAVHLARTARIHLAGEVLFNFMKKFDNSYEKLSAVIKVVDAPTEDPHVSRPEHAVA